MSILTKCDICGHNSDNTGVVITQEVPRTLIVKNYKGEQYKVFIYTMIEDKKDSDILDDFSELNLKEKLQLVSENHIDVANKCPIICEKCKLEVLQKAITNSEVEIQKTKDRQFIAKHQNHIETIMEIEELAHKLQEMSVFGDCEEDND